MSMIIASFTRRSDAHAAVDALKAAGFALEPRMPLNTDPEFEVRPEPAVSPGAEESGPTAAKGAAIGGAMGVIVGAFAGPVGALAGAGVGAYTGSLVGALKGLDATHPDESGEEGALIKVAAHGDDGRSRAIDILRAHGAAHVNEE